METIGVCIVKKLRIISIFDFSTLAPLTHSFCGISKAPISPLSLSGVSAICIHIKESLIPKARSKKSSSIGGTFETTKKF